jgi:hypothetical protein
MSNQTTIGNGYSGVGITCTQSGTGAVYLGGIVGDTAEGGTSVSRAIDGVTVTGSLTLKQTRTSGNGETFAGGAAGRTQAAVTFHDIEFTGSLSVSKGDGSTATNIGGITGYVSNGNYSQCIVTGSIGVPELSSTGVIYLGGIWGWYVNTVSTNAADCRAKNSITFNGATAYVGGVVGYLDPPTGASDSDRLTITNCRYEEGSITVTGSGFKYVGGFTGAISGNSKLNNCYTLAGTIDVKNSDGNLGAGGFSGLIGNATVTNCYSLADVVAEGSSPRVAAGGFVGQMAVTLSAISACYAAGDVRAISTDSTTDANYPFAVGGFAGLSNINGNSINNCYAFGAVTAEKRNATGDVNAGGIVGFLYGTAAIAQTINNCFFGGTVTAIRTNTGTVNAGGIAGNITTNNTITNSAATGASVTAMGGGADTGDTIRRNVGRIWGNGTASASTTGNYALSDMLIEDDPSATTFTPGKRDAVPSITGRDGANASASTFRNASIWTTMGFTTPLWSFSKISKGYPVLQGLGGQ